MNAFDNARQNLDYPQSFELRVITDATQAGLVQANLHAIISALDCGTGPIQTLSSSKPRFARLSAPVQIANATLMTQLYQAVGALPGVRFVL